jgi:ribonuclease BN (tRNA processing enzyme)
VHLTVLGSSASYAGAGHACAGHLLVAGDTTVLLDCGNGSLANAASHTDVAALDAVFVSHTHPDHWADLYSLLAALRFAPGGPAGSLPLHLPDGLFERISAPLSDHGREALAAAFKPSALVDGRTANVGPIGVTPRLVDHDGVSFAFRVEAEGARLCYTGDTRYGDLARAAASGCDVLLADCTLPTSYAGKAPHMTPGEAGRLASESGARVLVLTHLWPTADRGELLTDAAAMFHGEILLADESLSIDLTPAP